jgi:20S proteasome alpha/beta subunit
MQSRPLLKPPPRLLPVAKRMTIALGILASDGVAIAADSQETYGDMTKGFALKIHSAMTQTSIHSMVNSAVAITGAGSSAYLDAITYEILQGFDKHQDTDLDAFSKHLKECVEDFHARHVTPLPAHLAREIWVIVGAQIEGKSAMWSTDVSTVQPSLGFAAVGTGANFARMALHNRVVGRMNAEAAALLAILGVERAKQYDSYCGKDTTVTFLKNNLAFTVPPYEVTAANDLFERYAGIEYGAFLYALGKESLDDGQRPQRLTRLLRKLRGDFTTLAARLLTHNP